MLKPIIIRKIAKAKLIGRGCNNFPTAEKWNMVYKAKGKEKYVICNCSESEPGVFKDLYILDKFGAQMIQGIEIAMKTIKATKGFIYLNPEYYAKFQDYLHALIKGKQLNIELYQKPLHDYVGGEETAVINSMEGERVEPSLKPPYPTSTGFLNKPTLVNNCETFYIISQIANDEYDNTRFYCFSEFDVETQHATSPSKYKNQQIKILPVNISIKDILRKFNHEPSDKYFYQISGGASGNCYNFKQLNKTFKGLASIVAYKKSIPEKDVVMHWANFFENESCGQCIPCREGTYRIKEMLEKYYATGRMDRKLFDELVFSLQNTSFCPLGKVSLNAILSYWKNIKNIK